MYYTELPTTSLPLPNGVYRMNFRLPDHTKVMYASGYVKEHWQILINEAADAWQQIEQLSLLEGYRDSILIYAADWKQWKAWADEHGFIIVPLQTATLNGYSSYGTSSGNTWRCAVVRTPQIAAEWMDVYHDGGDDDIGRLLGYPVCCREFFHKYWVHEEYRDLTVPAILKDGIDGPAEANILGRWAGIRLVPHMPCSFTCADSSGMGRELAEIGNRNGFEKEVDTIYRLLRMPYKYSSLHGIAEITTPVFKVSAASEAYSEEVVFERKGELPEKAASGKQFPFTNQAKKEVTESPSFKRAIDHYRNESSCHVDQSHPHPTKWDREDADIRRPEPNGFSTTKAMDEAHEVILSVLDEDCGKVIDFGCGNGELLRKIRERFGLDVAGVDLNEEAVAQGKKMGLNLRNTDMFTSRLKGETAIVMPGRLIEREDTDRFVKHLESFHYLVLYAYSDWIPKLNLAEFGPAWLPLRNGGNEACKVVFFQNITTI